MAWNELRVHVCLVTSDVFKQPDLKNLLLEVKSFRRLTASSEVEAGLRTAMCEPGRSSLYESKRKGRTSRKEVLWEICSTSHDLSPVVA